MTETTHPLYQVALKVLEDWGMMLVDEAGASTDIFEADAQFYLSNVRMCGVFEGSISIVAQKPFIQTLASNLLGAGDEGEVLSEDSKDAFREMGNVLAGNYITFAYGEDVTFEMLNPTVKEIGLEELQNLAHPTRAFYFMADDAPVCITFNIEK